MKKIFLFLVSFSFLGCTAIQVPSYVKDTNPYTYTLYASYEESVLATEQALKKNGWEVQSTADPSIFEHNKVQKDGQKQILMITDTKDIPMFLGTRYGRLNVLLTSRDQDTTDLEIRYLTVNSILFAQFDNFKHPIAVDNLRKDIEKLLK